MILALAISGLAGFLSGECFPFSSTHASNGRERSFAVRRMISLGGCSKSYKYTGFLGTGYVFRIDKCSAAQRDNRVL